MFLFGVNLGELIFIFIFWYFIKGLFLLYVLQRMKQRSYKFSSVDKVDYGAGLDGSRHTSSPYTRYHENMGGSIRKAEF